jgi:hypothetical protein
LASDALGEAILKAADQRNRDYDKLMVSDEERQEVLDLVRV